MAGAEGNGQPQLFDCLAGRIPPRAGRVVLRDKELSVDLRPPRGGGRRDHAAPRRSQARGVDGCPGRAGQRQVQSLRRFSRIGGALAGERVAVEQLVEQLEIRTPSLDQPVEFLSKAISRRSPLPAVPSSRR